MKLKSLVYIVMIIGCLACNDAGFQSSTNEESPPLPVNVQCELDGTYNSENQIIPVPTDRQSVKLEVTGEFCPQAPANLTLIFLIDFSLSMYNKDVDPVRGNDQLIDGSCGRLDAAKAIIERTTESTKNLKTNLNVGVVAFSSDIEESIKPTNLDSFASDLSASKFCRGKGKTNYKAAFEEAESLLQDIDGTKIVYFITDGLPSLGGNAPAGLETEHQTAAIAAAKSLRKNISNLTLNTVYLGNTFEDIDVDPETVLEEITGDVKRVRIVKTADKLAQEILELDSPPVDLDTKSMTARFENGAQNPLPIDLTSFRPSSDRDQVWTFKTEPFEPFAADEGRPELIIEGKDKNGETYRIVFSIIPDTTPSSDKE